MSDTVRILLADDHAIVREGIRLMLESQPDLEVVGEAATGREAIAMVAAYRPSLVLMDLTMPDLGPAGRRLLPKCSSTHRLRSTRSARPSRLYISPSRLAPRLQVP